MGRIKELKRSYKEVKSELKGHMFSFTIVYADNDAIHTSLKTFFTCERWVK